MQKQPQGKNNPANPLIKVAALDIRRTHERVGKRASCYALIRLNFKKSNDMRGRTVDKQGNDITVNFTLAVKRANLEIKLHFENSQDCKYLTVSNVAFIESLSTNRSIIDSEEIDLIMSTEGAISASSSLSVDTPKLSGKAEAKARGSRTSVRKRDGKRQSKANYRVTGISATYAGNIINWSIDSLWTRREDIEITKDNGYLCGEVFQDGATGKHVKACRVSWNHNEASSGMEIHGSGGSCCKI